MGNQIAMRFSEKSSEHDVADIDEPAKSLLFIAGPFRVIGKLILPAKPNASVELYNLKTDPHETKNVAKETPKTVEQLTEKINQWWDGKS